MDEHDDDEAECNCVGCRINRQLEQFRKQTNAIGAANARRGFWTEVYIASIRAGDDPFEARSNSNMAVEHLDKAFPEVHMAAMEEDR